MATVGDVTSRRQGEIDFKPVSSEQNSTIFSKMRLQTNRASEAVAQFDNGARIKILESSKVVFDRSDRNDKAIQITTISGGLTALNLAARDKLEVIQNGERASLSDSAVDKTSNQDTGSFFSASKNSLVIHLSDLAFSSSADSGARLPEIKVTQPALDSTDPHAKNSVAAAKSSSPGTESSESGSRDTLTDHEIRTQISRQSALFQRCYYLSLAKSLAGSKSQPDTSQTNSQPTNLPVGSAHQLKGTIVLSFEIESTGHLSHATVIHSDFRDDAMNRCMLEVLDRTQFRAFDGRTVQVAAFPIRLE